MNLQEGDRNPYVDKAVEYGFKFLRQVGKHPIYKHPSGAQITVSSSGQTQGRALKNFERNMKRSLASAGVELRNKPEQKVQPVIEPKPIKPSKSSEGIRSKYRSGQPVSSGTPISFKDFMSRIQQAKATATPAAAPKSTSTTASRMATGYSNMLRNLPADEKVRLGNKVLSQITGRTYKPGSGYRTDRGIGLAD